MSDPLAKFQEKLEKMSLPTLIWIRRIWKERLKEATTPQNFFSIRTALTAIEAEIQRKKALAPTRGKQ